MKENNKYVVAGLVSDCKDIQYMTKKVFVFLFVFLIFNFSFCISLFGQDISFEVSVDKNKLSINSTAQLNVTVHGTQNIGAFDLPKIEGFELRYLGPSTRMSIVNGKVRSSITHIYKMIPLKTGSFKIPSFTIGYKGKDYSSNSISIEVLSGQGAVDNSGDRDFSLVNSQELEDRVFLVVEVEKRRIYINQIVPMTVKLYVNRLGIRDIQYPKFLSKNMSIEQFSEHEQYQDVLGGTVYDVIEFKTEGFALRSGEVILGPAQLECNLIKKKESRRRFGSGLFDDDFGSDLFSNFFGGYERHPLNLKSGKVLLDVLELPDKGKPENFNGAIGDFNLSIEINPKVVKVGDPITVKMIISGNGNFKTVKTPFFNIEEDFNIYEPQIEKKKSLKIFEQVIIPKNELITEIGEIKFSFFDPEKESYEVLKKGPIAITVNPLSWDDQMKIFDESNQDLFAREEILGRDLIYIKDFPGKLKQKGKYLYKNKLFIIIQFMPLLAVIFVFLNQKRKMRLKTDIGYARRLRALGKAKKNLFKTKQLLNSNKTNDFFDSVFKTLQEYLGDKFHLPSSGITSSILVYLKEKDVDQNLANNLENCFNRCDRARYSPSTITDEYMRDTFVLLQEIIDKFEKAKI